MSEEQIASFEGQEISFKPVRPTPVPGFPVDVARRVVFTYVKDVLEKTDTHVTFSLDEVYPVWFNFTLGNWKALLSTTLPDQMYYEVTYNGDKDEFYLDAYKKWNNVKISADTLRG
jgi:hypothetical protein